MDIIGLLQKLGILRYGAKSYEYTSGQDMPVEAFMDDLYDEDKDLITSTEEREEKDQDTPDE